MSTVHLNPIHDTVDAEFAGIVQPIVTTVARPRCADGHGTLTHLFFSEVPLDIARAKAICGKCTLADTCRQAAVDRAEPWGVWGGVSIENGKVVGDIALTGYKAAITGLMALMEKAAAGHVKPTLSTFSSDYRGLVHDLEVVGGASGVRRGCGRHHEALEEGIDLALE